MSHATITRRHATIPTHASNPATNAYLARVLDDSRVHFYEPDLYRRVMANPDDAQALMHLARYCQRTFYVCNWLANPMRLYAYAWGLGCVAYCLGYPGYDQ